MEEIANEAGQTMLLEQIEARFEDMSIEPDAVFHGILWYAQACHADPRAGNGAKRFTPLQSAVDAGASPLWALGQQVTGATILRLYVAIVYLRGDWFAKRLGGRSWIRPRRCFVMPVFLDAMWFGTYETPCLMATLGRPVLGYL